MLTDIRRIIARSPQTLAEDALGCAAILVTLLVALHLPGFV
ncbi:hypothetical protein [Maritimibacter sp. 55A14]|nr:hypothetical protein [Maritimibacter sp. 55A14]